MTIEMIEEEFEQGTVIKVLGVGGGGGNAVEHMITNGVQGVEFICANTDAQALSCSSAEQIIKLGSTGRGAGSKPEVGQQSAQSAVNEIRDAIQGANMLFVTAGMGGGTGTGAAPVIAKIAKEMGILTVGVVTKPFEFEGTRRMKNAEDGIQQLEESVDSLIVILNEKLMEEFDENISQEDAFISANNVLRDAVGGIAEVINVPGLINVDFEDVRTIMETPGKAMMGTGVAEGKDRAINAAEKAVACPLLEGVDLAAAKGVLVLISSSKASRKLIESKQAMQVIRKYVSDDANVIFGAAYDENLSDSIRITVIATGVGSAALLSAQSNNMTLIDGAATGTDDLSYQEVQVWGGNITTKGVQSSVGNVPVLRNDDIEIPAYLRKQAD